MSKKISPSFLAVTLAALLCIPGAAQQPSAPAPDAATAPAVAEDVQRPLPDINALMNQVEANERRSESIQKDYIYDESSRLDKFDSHQNVKQTETRQSEVFWINGIVIRRILAKDGKPFTADELKKENDRIDGEVQKAKARRDKADAQGRETDPRGHDELTFSRILELGSFSNPRRELINGRPTIAIDYRGNPQAKTHNYAEGVFRELVGSVWVDEQDKTLQHVEGHFDHDFKIGGGLVVDVKSGTWFKGSFRKVNDEVWLPASFEADGRARYLLFLSLSGHASGQTGNYRKFKATTTILPGLTTLPPDPTPSSPPPPS